MNARERKLLVVTLFVVGAGAFVWFGESSPPAEADGPSVTPPSTPPAPMTDENALPVAVSFSVSELVTFLESFPRTMVIPSTDDPFRSLTPSEIPHLEPRTTPPLRDLPHLGGVFFSGPLKGALLDGEVVFIGDTVEGHYRLIDVAADRVRILYHDQEVDLVYDPVNAPGTRTRGAEEGENERR